MPGKYERRLFDPKCTQFANILKQTSIFMIFVYFSIIYWHRFANSNDKYCLKSEEIFHFFIRAWQKVL